MTKKEMRSHLKFLRQVIRDAEKAIDEGNWSDLAECCNDLDGTSALIREGIENR